MTDKDLTDAYKIARKYTKTHQDAQEVVQDAAIKAYLKGHQCKKNPAAWFRGIVRTTALNQHRKDVVNVEFNPRYHSTTYVEYNENLLCQLDLALEELTSRELSYVKAKFTKGRKFKDIAVEEGVTRETITNTYKKAIKKLRENIKVLQETTD